jgi:hypothetical protein
MSDHTVDPSPTGSDEPRALFATTRSLTALSGPLPGVAMSQIATVHDVVEMRARDDEYSRTSKPVIGELLAEPALQRRVTTLLPKAVAITAVTGSGLSCTETLIDPHT